MINNGIFSFPSSQLLYIVSGYLIFKGYFSFAIVLLVGALGNTIGNYILYSIAKNKGMEYSVKFVSFFFPKDRVIKEIKKVEVAFKKRGALFLFIGKLLNPIKVIIPIPAGISHMRKDLFIIITFVTSFIWATIFASLGYFFGESYKKFSYFGVIMVVVASIVLFVFYKFINSEVILKEVEGDVKKNNIKKSDKKKLKKVNK